MSFRLIQKLLVALALFFTVLPVVAHEPFDGSVRMLVHDDSIEATVTLGLDAARGVLSATGLSKENVAEFVRPKGPHSKLEMPAAVAPHLLVIQNGTEPLTARSGTILSEGLEVIFTLLYPRPETGTLDVRAVFYEEITGMRQGSFVAYDENALQLGAALLSRVALTAQVSLPAASVAAIASTNEVPPAHELSSESPTPPPVQQPSFAAFLKLGVGHILTGFDHLLFLVALLVGVRKPLTMLGIITAFTLAHSVTLALSVFDLVTISPRIVEPLIAASIIIVCVENLVRQNAPTDRFWLAGGFGLIHGFGFAGALRETGLGQTGASAAVPLLSFNLGVEAGQLAVVAVVLPLLLLLRRWPGFARHGAFAVSGAVIVVSAYWLLERTIF